MRNGIWIEIVTSPKVPRDVRSLRKMRRRDGVASEFRRDRIEIE